MCGKLNWEKLNESTPYQKESKGRGGMEERKREKRMESLYMES